jgi:hypothetical protein
MKQILWRQIRSINGHDIIELSDEGANQIAKIERYSSAKLFKTSSEWQIAILESPIKDLLKQNEMYLARYQMPFLVNFG